MSAFAFELHDLLHNLLNMSYPTNTPPDNTANWPNLPSPNMLDLTHQPIHPRLHAAWSILRATFKYPHLVSPEVFSHIHALDCTETVDGKPTIDFDTHYNAVIIGLKKIPERLPTFEMYVGFVVQGMEKFCEEWRLAVLEPLVEKLVEVEGEGRLMQLGEAALGKKMKVEPELFFDNVKAAEQLMKDLQLAMREEVTGNSRMEEVYEKISECALHDEIWYTWYDAADEVKGGRGDGETEKLEGELPLKVNEGGVEEINGDDNAEEAVGEKIEERKSWVECGDAGEHDDSEQLDALDNLFEFDPQCVVL